MKYTIKILCIYWLFGLLMAFFTSVGCMIQSTFRKNNDSWFNHEKKTHLGLLLQAINFVKHELKGVLIEHWFNYVLFWSKINTTLYLGGKKIGDKELKHLATELENNRVSHHPFDFSHRKSFFPHRHWLNYILTLWAGPRNSRLTLLNSKYVAEDW